MKFSLFIMGTRTGGYRDILDQVCYAEELGFHTVHLPERHFEHGDLLCPSPFTVAAAIAARTTTIRIATAARILPLDHPIHIAEDAATLDILSNGRLDFGATRASLDEQCHSAFGSPTDQSRGRFEEALEVIELAWTKDQFEYAGKHYQIPRVSVSPKPVQKPHPPIYIVAVSPETLTFAARKGYSTFIAAIRSVPELTQSIELYRRVFKQSNHNGHKYSLPVNRFIYVSETDHQARREFERPFMAFMEHRAPDLKAALLRKYGGPGTLSFDRFEHDFCVLGSPDTVAARLRELHAAVGTDSVLCTLNYITLDHGRCVRSMEMFAREVMPRLGPSWPQPAVTVPPLAG